MKKILIKNFPNLNNYGTGMMGLITIQSLINNYGKENIEVYCAFDKYANIEEICQELPESIQLNTYVDNETSIINNIKSPLVRKMRILWNLFFEDMGNRFDIIIVLGGDDYSEYYSKRYGASKELFKLWRYSKHSKVVMLGQTIGPFSRIVNRFVYKHLLPKIKVYARDPWTVEYVRKKLNVEVKLMGDLAFNSLPLQGDSSNEKNILKKYGLIKNEYFTIVMSGLVHFGYYCKSEEFYVLRHYEIIIEALKLDRLCNKKVVLLAHTFPPYGDESLLIQKLFEMFSLNDKKRIILIKDKIYPTKARFILGNGIFTITGRMHPAVSTFQMGKPAISLSYSTKYYGVIGQSINRTDLIIDAKESAMWLSGQIVSLASEKIKYLLDHYIHIISEIKYNVNNLVDLNNESLKEL